MKIYPAITCVLMVVVLNACSHLSKPDATHAQQEALQRGWSFIEDESELLKTETGAPELNFSSGAIYGNRFIYGSQRFGLMALNKNSGKVYWRKQVEGGISANVLVAENRIFVGDNTGYFHAYSDSGNELWKANLNFPISGTPAMGQGRVVVGTIDHALHALDMQTGKILWTFRRGATASTTIKGGGSATYFNSKFWVGFADGTLVALEPNDGSVVLEKQFQDNAKFSDIDAAPLAWKNGLFVNTYDGKLRYIKSDGSIQWLFPAGGAHAPIPSPIMGGVIFLGSSDGAIYAVQEANAKEIWKHTLRKGIPTGITLVSDKEKHTLVVASSDNFIYAFDATNGKLLTKISIGSSSGTYGDLVADMENPKRVFLVSHYGRIYQLKINR